MKKTNKVNKFKIVSLSALFCQLALIGLCLYNQEYVGACGWGAAVMYNVNLMIILFDYEQERVNT